MRYRRAFLILLAASAARAADAPEPAADSVAAAKKDIAAIKALNAPSDNPAQLPTVDIKSLSPGPVSLLREAPVAPRPDQDASADPSSKRDKGATGNWLVDAMDRASERARQQGGKDGAPRDDRDSLRTGDRTALRADQDSELQDEGRDDRLAAKEPAAAAYNPLEAFMGQWVSARDRDLLLPESRGDGVSGGGPGRAGAGLSGEGASAQPGDVFAGLLPPPEAASEEDSKAAPNPYLAAMDLQEAAPVKLFATPDAQDLPLTSAQSGPSWFGSQPGTLDTPRSFIPDFARPSDDDKYFKQMKRF